MAQQSLYRRYRPRRFGEIKGQEHVVRALRNAVSTESEGHAYLFSGPRGTGKTSTARILAKALNCTDLRDGEPCCECESCVAIEAGRSFDLFELDAASNNGVDAVRDLVERASVSSPGRTKVYILDEVHMLTAAASNALLKTLEEPPDHVRFVLATTDPQKVLPTIRSRTQHFEFFLLSADELADHVRWVAKDAGLDIDTDAVAHAVRQGRGSVRDTLSALDQVVAAGGVLVRSEPVEKLFEAIAGSDPGVAIVAVADAISQGHDPRVLGEAFLAAVRDAFLVSLGVDTPHMVDADRERTSRWATEIGTPGLTRAMERVGEALVDMRTAADPRVPLEVALVQLTAGQAPPASAPAADTAGQGGAGASHDGALEQITSRLDRLEARMRAGTTGSAASDPGASRETRRPAGDAGGETPGGKESEPAERPRREDRSSGSGSANQSTRSERPSGGSERPSGRSAPPPPPPRRRGGGASRSAQPRRGEQSSEAAQPVAETAPTPVAGESKGPGAQHPDSRPEDGQPREPAAGATAGEGQPDRDSIVMAFGDHVVPKLKGVAKAIYSGGRFLTVADGTAVFALDNAPTIERAEKYRAAVEGLLADSLGVPVPIRLVTEGDAGAYATTDAGGSPANAARETRAGRVTDLSGDESARHREKPRSQPQNGGDTRARTEGASSDPTEEDEAELVARVDDLEDADVATRGVDRLTEAFPGAELIEEEKR